MSQEDLVKNPVIGEVYRCAYAKRLDTKIQWLLGIVIEVDPADPRRYIVNLLEPIDGTDLIWCQSFKPPVSQEEAERNEVADQMCEVLMVKYEMGTLNLPFDRVDLLTLACERLAKAGYRKIED